MFIFKFCLKILDLYCCNESLLNKKQAQNATAGTSYAIWCHSCVAINRNLNSHHHHHHHHHSVNPHPPTHIHARPARTQGQQQKRYKRRHSRIRQQEGGANPSGERRNVITRGICSTDSNLSTSLCLVHSCISVHLTTMKAVALILALALVAGKFSAALR